MEARCDGVDRIQLASEGVQRQTCEHSNELSGPIKGGGIS